MNKRYKIKTTITRIMRQYPKVNAEHFFHRSSYDLKRTFKKALFWFLVYEPKNGYSIFDITFSKRVPRNFAMWSQMVDHSSPPLSDQELENLARYGRKNHASIKSTFRDAVLDSVNTRDGTSYRLIKMIGFTYAIRKSGSARQSIKRDSRKSQGR